MLKSVRFRNNRKGAISNSTCTCHRAWLLGQWKSEWKSEIISAHLSFQSFLPKLLLGLLVSFERSRNPWNQRQPEIIAVKFDLVPIASALQYIRDDGYFSYIIALMELEFDSGSWKYTHACRWSYRRLAKYQIWVNGWCGKLQLDHSVGLEANAQRRDAGKVEWRRSAYKCQQDQQEMSQVDTKGENAILLIITKGERRTGILATLAAWCPQPTEPRVCNDWQSLVGQWHDTIAVDSKPKLLPVRNHNVLAQEMRFPCFSTSTSKLIHTVKGIIIFQV